MIQGTLSTQGTQPVCFLSASPMLVGVLRKGHWVTHQYCWLKRNKRWSGHKSPD